MKRLFIPFVIILISAGAIFAQSDRVATDKSLYQRLGGYDALAGVTDDFVGRLVTDKTLGKFFVGLSNDSKTRVRQHVIDFLCKATGGPCAYTGRDMKLVHTGLNITKKEWDASVKHLISTLDKFKVPAKEKGEVLAAVGPLEKDVVEQKKTGLN